jgi:heat shock protein HtpX
MEALNCFYICLSTAGLVAPILLLTGITALLFAAFHFNKGFKPLMGAQFSMTLVISASLASMECYMSSWVWVYMAIIMGGSVVVAIARGLINGQLLKANLGSFDALSDLEDEFGITISVLDTQRVRAMAFRGRVWLSVGLVELLSDDEIRAVVAHEVFHVRMSPSKFLSLLLAITSLTFRPYSDERAADSFAARIAGVDTISSALERLNIADHDLRTRSLRHSQ